MTLVVGANLGAYSLLAADDRITWFDRPDAPPRIEDDVPKVLRTSVGLASGSGVWQIVDGVIRTFVDDPRHLDTPEGVTEFLQGFMGPAGFFSTARIGDERVRAMAHRVGWMFTSVEANRSHLRFYHSDCDFVPLEPPPRMPAVLLPMDVTPQQSVQHERVMMNAFRVAKEATEIDASLEHNMRVLVRFFRSIVSISKVLGQGIQLGYQTVAGEVELTKVLPLADL